MIERYANGKGTQTAGCLTNDSEEEQKQAVHSSPGSHVNLNHQSPPGIKDLNFSPFFPLEVPIPKPPKKLKTPLD